MKLKWLALGFLGMLLWALPAQAGRLLFWKYDATQNRLVFTTDDGVQPQAQMIFYPTRLIIDLPGTKLNRQTVKQPLNGLIQELRIGQPDDNTTRLVIQVADGYTFDAQSIKIVGKTPTEWTVDLPQPKPFDPKDLVTPATNPSPGTPTNNGDTSDLQVTDNGFFVTMDLGGTPKIKTDRSDDGQQITVDVENARLKPGLLNKTVEVKKHQVESIQFQQTSTSPDRVKMTLKVAANSPDWQVLVSKLGGLVFVPKNRGVNASIGTLIPARLVSGNPNLIAMPPIAPSPINMGKMATISGVDLVDGGTRLLIRGDQPLQAFGNWNRSSGFYEIQIANAKLADPVRGPSLTSSSSISRIRLRQDNDRTVMVMVQPSVGVRVGNLQSTGQPTLSLPLAVPAILPPGNNGSPPFTPPRTTDPPIFTNPNPQRKILVTIDPGHGGYDPGAIGINGFQEKGLVLSISQQVAQILQQNGIQVLMTRNSDYFVTLQDRTIMSNNQKANLFVSIHANSINLSRQDVSGLETYYYQNGGELAQTIHRSILQRVPIRDRGVRTARFYVLRTSNVPAVLVEVGFVTGREDYENLSRAEYRSQMADGIAAGILQYIQANFR